MLTTRVAAAWAEVTRKAVKTQLTKTRANQTFHDRSEWDVFMFYLAIARQKSDVDETVSAETWAGGEVTIPDQKVDQDAGLKLELCCTSTCRPASVVTLKVSTPPALPICSSGGSGGFTVSLKSGIPFPLESVWSTTDRCQWR